MAGIPNYCFNRTQEEEQNYFQRDLWTTLSSKAFRTNLKAPSRHLKSSTVSFYGLNLFFMESSAN